MQSYDETESQSTVSNGAGAAVGEATAATKGATPPTGSPPAGSAALAAPPTSKISLKKLRLSQDFAATMGVRKLLTNVAVRKPLRHEWVYVHPGEDFQLPTYIFDLKEDRGEQYVVDTPLVPEVIQELVPKVLYLCVNKQKVPFIWPVRLPGPDGKIDRWSASARDAAAQGQKGWIRVASNLSAGAYDIYQPSLDLGEPEWPEQDFETLVQIAFKDHFIDTLDHPVLRKLRGEL